MGGSDQMVVWALAVLGSWEGRQCQGSPGHRAPCSDVILGEGAVSPLTKAVALGWARCTHEGHGVKENFW